MVKLDTDAKIKAAWTKSGFLTIEKFKRYLRKNEYEFKVKDVKTFIDNQESTQISKKVVRPKEFNSVVAHKIRDNYEVDLMVYDRYEINGYSYVFGCIDTKSRYAHCIPMTNRKGSTILKCFKQTFKIMGVPKRINMDNEFKSKELVKYLANNKIEVFYSFADEAFESMKNPIIERFWRTLATLLQSYRTNTGNKKWYEYLNRVVNSYNNSEHGTIKTEPLNVWKQKDKSQEIYTSVGDKYKKGDIVRLLLKKKGAFAKADALRYTKELYELVRRDTKLVNRWILKNVSTGTLTRPHMPRDFLPVDKAKIQRPKVTSTRAKVKDSKLSKPSKVKARKLTNKTLKDLELSKGSINYRKTGKRVSIRKKVVDV
mgnify:CR=1 FL=1